MNTLPAAELKILAEKIATELVFAEAGKDTGLLPVYSLISDIETLLIAKPAPEIISLGARQARGWVEEILETSGVFSAPALKKLGQWVVWWQDVISACEAKTPPPPAPAVWSVADGEKPATAPRPVASAAEESPTDEETPLVFDPQSDRDLLEEFVSESREHLQNIEQGVLVLEDHPADAQTLDSIFRAFHTFKGGSGFLNLTAIQTLAHELESLLDDARRQKLALTPPVIDVILEGGDALKKFVDEIAGRLAGGASSRPILVPTRPLLRRIRSLLNGEIETQPSPAVAVPTVPATREKSETMATSIKVDTGKLDSLIDLVGEMVIAQSLVVQNPELAKLQNEKLTRDLANLRRITRDLQRTAMALRTVPLEATFQKMNRLVRDLAARLDKKVELVIEGEDTELDRTMVEEISDPLAHMVRNSVDHGIERPDARTQQGKPATGTISLKAWHQGGNVVVEIKDDGQGLNRERILAKAIEKGLAQSGEILSDKEVFSLVLEPGFSTAEKITDLSGRGVGMDVVKRNIEKLRGKLEIGSVAGQGTTFTVHLPLTLAIIDGLLVAVGSHRYILPTLTVRESFRPTPGMISTVRGTAEMITVRGRLYPLLRLYAHLGIAPLSTDPAQSIVMIVEAGDQSRCVMVDKLLGKQEVVIKNLGETFRQNRNLAGAAVLGDGGVGLILDPQSLVHLETHPLKDAA